MRSFLAATFPMLPFFSLWFMRRSDTPPLNGNRDKWDPEYDYIIVGGGSAGSVLANRLSENPFVRVLLLEAGGNENKISDIPLAYQSLQQTPLDWEYMTEPQKAACFGHKEKVCWHYLCLFNSILTKKKHQTTFDGSQ